MNSKKNLLKFFCYSFFQHPAEFFCKFNHQTSVQLHYATNFLVTHQPYFHHHIIYFCPFAIWILNWKLFFAVGNLRYVLGNLARSRKYRRNWEVERDAKKARKCWGQHNDERKNRSMIRISLSSNQVGLNHCEFDLFYSPTLQRYLISLSYYGNLH